MNELNAVSLELFKNRLSSIVDEMSLTVVRTARSQIVRDVMDFSTALCDAEGRLVTQGLGLALHLGAVPPAMDAVRTMFAGTMQPGDIYVLNDPYSGGMHLPDIFLFKPIFGAQDRLLGFAVVIAHQADIGGRVPGGNAADSTEIFQEGLRIPPLRLWDGGRENWTLLNIVRDNVRTPDTVLGDINAQVSASHIGERGLRWLEGLYAAALPAYFDALLDYTERLARHELASMPRGRWESEDWLDDDGVVPEPVRLAAAVEITDDGLIVDFTGSAPQVRGAVNCTRSYACSVAYCAVRFLMKSEIPVNEGFFRFMTVITPEGTIVNPRFPAAVAARGVTGYRAGDAVLGALAKAMPERAMAGNWGGGTVLSIGGSRPDGSRFIFTESIHGNWGGRPTKDGQEGLSHPMGNLSNAPVEHIEAEFPLQILRYGFVSDSGGAGRFRGGLALDREYLFLGVTGTLQVRADRLKFAARPVAGGAPGTLARNQLIRAGVERDLLSKVTLALEYGDRFYHRTAGAAGHGSPALRDPERVRADVIDGKVSPAQAADVYGIAVDQGLT